MPKAGFETAVIRFEWSRTTRALLLSAGSDGWTENRSETHQRYWGRQNWLE